MPNRRLPDTANYIASLSGDLAQLARANGLETLAFLLDMAQLEAEHFESNAETG